MLDTENIIPIKCRLGLFHKINSVVYIHKILGLEDKNLSKTSKISLG